MNFGKLTHNPQIMRAIFVQHTAEPSGSPISGLLAVKAMKSLGYTVDVYFGVPGSMKSEYMDLGCKTKIVPHGHWLFGRNLLRKMVNALRELPATFYFTVVFIYNRPKIVYVNTAASLAPVIAARISRVHCLWHLRELFVENGGEMHLPLGGKRVVKWATRNLPEQIICVSNAVAETYAGAKDCQPKVRVIANAVSRSFVHQSALPKKQARKIFELPTNEYIVAVPATLRPVKGIEFLIRAAELIHKQRPDIIFAVTGRTDNDHAQYLTALTKYLNLSRTIIFMGHIKDMAYLYAAADCVCIPSRSESFGRGAIEAFAARRPVVATSVGGLTEVITDRVNGILVPYNNHEALARNLLAVAEDPRQSTELARKGYETYLERFTEEAHLRHIRETVPNSLRNK